MVSSTAEHNSRLRQSWPIVRSLGWRPLAGVLAGLLSCVPMLIMGLVALHYLPVDDARISGQQALVRELVQVLTYTGCALVGLLVSLSTVVALTGQSAAGGKLSLPRAFARAVSRTPLALAAVLASSAWALAALVGAPVFVLVALARALVWHHRARTAGTDFDRAIASAPRRAALVSAIPFMAFVRAVVLVAFALTTATLGTGSVRGVLAQARALARGRTLRGVGFLAPAMLFNAALGALVMPALAPTGTSSTGWPAVSVVVLYTAGTTAFGLALGLLAASVGVASHDPGAASRRSMVPWRGSRPLLRFKRPVSVTTVMTVTVAMLAALVHPATAMAATPPDLVVNTLTDSLTPDPDECQAAPTCSLRGALEYATNVGSPPFTITFSISGTIATLDTLDVPNGVSLDGHDGITLDGGNAHGVIDVVAGDSASAALSHISVVNGKKDTAGAGVYAPTANLTLDHVHFKNNISGVDGDTGVNGGAVSANYASVTVLDSTFEHNTALAGRGGAVSANYLTWTNSTSYANYGEQLEATGGALYSSFGGTVTHGTVLEGGGISGATYNPIRVVNTLSDTDHGTGEFACFNVTRDTDPEPSVGNVDITGSCGGKAANPGPVGPLADNGGPTPTVALLAGSGALGAGDSSLCLATDQRGNARTASNCDAGAYQLSAGDVAATVTVDAMPTGADPQSDAFIVHVEVPSGYSPAGHLVVMDGTTVNGPGIDINPDGPGNTMGAAMVPFTLAPGKHTLRVRFTADSSLIAVSNSAPFSYTARADATAKITATSPLTVGQATTINVDMSPVDATADLLTPTGDVEIGNGADTTTLTLAADGTASWVVPALLRGTVTVRYLGDNAFRALTFSAVVATDDVPSTSTLSLGTGTPTVGTPLLATAHVSGGGATAYGTAQIRIDGTLVTAGPLVGGVFSEKLPTDKLSEGTHTATVEYVPEAGWSASTTSITFEVLPAPVTATLTFDHPSITWGDFATGTVHLKSDHDGNVAVDLMAGNTVLTSTWASITGGNGSVDIPLFQLVRPMTGPLHVRVTGTDRFAQSISPDATLTVAPAQTFTLISTPSFTRFPPVAGTPMTLRIHVTPSTTHGVPIDGTVAVFLNGTLAGTFHVSDASTDVQVTPTMGGIVDARAEFTDTSPSPALLPSMDARGLNVGAGASTALTGTWAGALKPGSTQLAVTLADATGTLAIVDTNGTTYGAGTLANGTATLDFTGHATSYAGLFLSYAGDTNHQGASILLPPVTLTAWASSTTAAAATTVARDAALSVHASVTGLPDGTTGRVELFDGTDAVGSTLVTGNGTVDLAFTSMALGAHSLRTKFTPTVAGDVLGSTSPAIVVTVLDHAAPTAHLSAPSSVVAGSDFTVTVTAAAGQYGLGAGGSISLVRSGDSTGRAVASGVLTTTPSGLGATITVPGQVAGTLSLTGVFAYGNYFQSTSTEPVSITVTPVTPTLQVTAEGPLTFGAIVPVTLSANAPRSLAASATSMTVALSANGIKVGDVVMARTETGTGPLWTGTATVIPDHAGALTLDASTTGAGPSIGAASTSTAVWVGRRATAVTLSDRTPERTGRAAHDLNVDLAAVGGFSQLTAADEADLRITLAGSPGTCVVAGLICTFPQGVVPVGESTAYASYPGNTDFLPAYASTSVHAQARTSELKVTMDPPASAWRYGQDVRVSWRTDTSGAPAAGTVYVSAGSADCHGAALAGSCTLTLPTWDGNGDNPGLDVAERFVPSDDAPRIDRTYTVTPAGCVWVAVSQAHVRPGTGAACGPDHYLTNTPITVVADPGTNMHVTGWTLNGEPTVDGVVFSPQLFTHNKVPAVEETLTFTPKTATIVRTSERWSPVCYTLDLGGSDRFTIKTAGGMVSAYTAPNCSSPWMPTAAERADQYAGVPSYAEGTVVSLTALPANTYRAVDTDVVEHPLFAVDSWGNATPDPRHPSTIANITMTGNRAVDATFKVDDCSAFVLAQPTGATMRVVSTQRPDSSGYLRPWSGACTTKDGRPGYVPGTTAVVEVTPHNDGSVRPPPNRDQYFVQGLAFAPTGANAVGSFPDARAYRTSKFETTLSRTLNPTLLTAQMGHIACVPLATRLEVPFGAHPPEVTYADTPNCPARPGTFTHADMAGGAFVAHTTTDWFVEGSGTNVYVADTPVSLSYPSFQYDVARPDYDVVVDKLADRRSEDRMHPLFAVAVAGKPMSAYTLGHWIALDEGSDPVVVGRWMSDQCRPLHVSLPTGGQVKVSPETPQCASGSFPSYVKTLTVSVAGLPSNETPNLMPWFSVDAYSDPTGKTFSPPSNTDKLAANGRWYSPDYRGYVELNTNYLPRMRMEVCAKINIVVEVEDASGHRSRLENKDRVVTTDGGCPPGWAQAGRDMHVGLTEAGNYAYEIIGPVAHQPTTLTVANDGTNPGAYLRLRAFCYHLNAGEDVNITSPANCPGGGGGDFVRGSVVQLDADVNPGDHFHGWGPVDGKDGQTAFVAMTADRSVTVDVGHASTADKIAAGFSSVAQRIVGLGATILTGLIMAEAAAYGLASLAIKAATALAKVCGASDSVVFFMEAVGADIDSQIAVFTSLATCTSSWAAGGSGTLVPGGAPGGAIKAGDWAAMKGTNSLLVKKGATQLNADLVTGAVNPVDWVNAFGSHADNYLRDPAEAWGDIGSIGTCMQDTFTAYQVASGIRPAG